MRVLHFHQALPYVVLSCLLATVPSCKSQKKYDWKNREIAWTYGPTTGAARSEHLIGTGTKGARAIAEGWKCRLSAGKHLTVKPYKLAASHALFGKATMIISLFDKTGAKIATIRSEAITAQNATFSFEITEDLAKPLYDLVIWFGKA